MSAPWPAFTACTFLSTRTLITMHKIYREKYCYTENVRMYNNIIRIAQLYLVCKGVYIFPLFTYI